MGYISAQQAATKWGISKRRVQVLCTENRIKNATRIGNMWVVPEDALKPADGRVQTHHTVESPTARAARTALKKLTVNAYQEINGKLNNPSTSKMVFVSLLATTIFCDIQNDESSNEKDDVFLMISSELLEIEFKESSRRSFWEMFSSLVSDFEKYIYRYADYVDDILSWAYQYVNKLSLDSGLESTQFFTEEYMIEYLTKGIPRTTTASSVYLDPACGGGNFLSHILNQLFVLRYRELDNPIACIENIFNALYGSARRQPGDSFVAPKPAPECRYFIDKKFWESFLDRYDQPYSLCWRSLTSPTNQRTMIASIIPSMPTCQSVQLLQTTPVEDLLMILALFNSKVFDFFVRLKMGGIDLTQSVVRQIPVPFREAWNSMVTLHGVDYTALDAVRALERLLYRNEPDLCGLWDGVPEIKNADNYYKTAADVREEIDKIIFQMYGLTSAEEKMVRNSFKA